MRCTLPRYSSIQAKFGSAEYQNTRGQFQKLCALHPFDPAGPDDVACFVQIGDLHDDKDEVTRMCTHACAHVHTQARAHAHARTHYAAVEYYAAAK